VFFSIDQVNAQIFNADSLPYGTSVTGLVPIISYTSVSKIELQIPRKNGSDTIVNYLENTADSVDFSNGPVKIRVVADDGITERTYTVRVNVHQVLPDTLIWSRAQQSNLPSTFAVPVAQHTTATADAIYCITENDGKYCMGRAANPGEDWQVKNIALPFTPRIETFTGTDDALYMLDSQGRMYTSADALTWTPTAEIWDNIYGNYGTELWGSRCDNGKWLRVSYPTGKVQEIEDDFPVAQTSGSINYTFEMSYGHQMMLTGGRLASGAVSGNTWGYDGNVWMKLSDTPLPYPLLDPVVVPYFVSKVNSNRWSASRESVLLAFCGQRADGKLNDTVYVSNNFGITWKKADVSMQFPSTFPPRTRAQGFVYTSELSDNNSGRASSPWTDVAGVKLPLGAKFVPLVRSRATYPITSWECPYIYVFGGEDVSGNTFNTVWRGVVRRFTFKPLQ